MLLQATVSTTWILDVTVLKYVWLSDAHCTQIINFKMLCHYVASLCKKRDIIFICTGHNFLQRSKNERIPPGLLCEGARASCVEQIWWKNVLGT